MDMRRIKLFTLVAVGALALAGCRHHPPKPPEKGGGTTDGAKPGSDTARDSDRRTTAPEVKELPEIMTKDMPGPLGDVYFDFDRYEIRPDQRATLEVNAKWLL